MDGPTRAKGGRLFGGIYSGKRGKGGSGPGGGTQSRDQEGKWKAVFKNDEKEAGLDEDNDERHTGWRPL